MYQTTIKNRIIFKGRGLHTGKVSKVILDPLFPNRGIVFSDLSSSYNIEYRVSPYNVNMTYLSTSINIKNYFNLFTVEHLMSALLGLGVDNIKISVEGPEIPVLDGSSAPFVESIREAGIRVFPVKRKYLKIKKKIVVHNGEKWIEIIPSRFFKVTCKIDFKGTFINEQEAFFKITPNVYEREISKARTFGFKKDVLALRKRGLALGGSLENAIIIDDREIINNKVLRYSNEFVRHKILDLIGDLSLLNFRILGHVKAYKSGHSLNNLLAKAILADRMNYDLIEISDSENISSYNYNQIMVNPQTV